MNELNLHIYDSQAAAVRRFEPARPGHVGIYLCGATVQGSPHIGHVRSALAFDVLIRWLRRCGQEVTYVRNVTDIDDKILAKAAQNDEQWWALAYRFEREFDAAYQRLGLLPPTYAPHATAHITDQIELIERLMERGHAYADGTGNVYFAVASEPSYGSLTRQSLDNLTSTEDETQAAGIGSAGKRDGRDFTLWKAAKESEPESASWNSPWGRGRPGWHLECSAMAQRYLGETFDIHGGGIDLRFPHHENEQAQSRAAGWGFARYWMHNAWVTTKGEKMSKSLGNSLSVEEITKTVDPAVLRFALGTVRYSSTVEYSPETLTVAAKNWERVSEFVVRGGGEADIDADLSEVELPAAFVAAMDDDLNVSGALASVYASVKAGNTKLAAGASDARAEALEVRAMMDVLGLDPLSPQWRSACDGGDQDRATQALDVFVNDALKQRSEARAEKDWARADAIRDRLQAAGITVTDGADGASWHLG